MMPYVNVCVITMTLLCCWGTGTLAAVDVDQGLQGFWGFEEGAGGSSVDDSTSNVTAQLLGEPTWASGKVGNALYFNGESSYVKVDEDARYSITESLSLAAWVKINNPEYAAYTRIISKKYNWDDAAGYELEYNAATNRLAFIAGGADIAYALNVDLDTNWHHLAASVSGTQVQLYLDGQPLTMTDSTIGALVAGDAPLCIGRNSSAAAPFIGLIDEVRLYDQALHAEAIAALAWTGLGQRVIQWSGYNWLVKNAELMGPGPNAWNDASDAVWVDANGRLHLTVTQVNGVWKSAEVIGKKVLGYGSYVTTLNSSLAAIDPQMVLGVFVYKDDDHEVDVEYSAWGNAQSAAYRQFVVQPYYLENHLLSMPGSVDGAGTVYQIDWMSDSISCSAQSVNWNYTQTYVPVNNPHMHLNLWLFQGKAPQSLNTFEVVFESFNFIPEADVVDPEPEPETDAVIHWLMEEGNGAVVADIGLMQHDATMSEATWASDVERNNFVYFDGKQDALVVADAPGLDMLGNQTISLWLRNDRPNQRLYQRLLSKKSHWTDETGYEIVYHPYRNEIQFVGQGSRLAYARNIDLDTAWHHLVFTINGTEAHIYVDGVAQVMTQSDVGVIQDSSLDLYMGRMFGGYGDLKGGLDDIRIFNHVLSDEAINNLYVEGIAAAN